MKDKFITFLESLRDGSNGDVIDSVKTGYKTVVESYADVVDVERTDAISSFTRSAAMTAMQGGMPVMQFLQNSADKLSQTYTYDTEPELDSNKTWKYSEWWMYSSEPQQKSWEETFGLTAQDLSDMSGLD